VTDPGHGAAQPRTAFDRGLEWTIALLMVAQAAVVGLQVVARHVLRQPYPWTEEVARLLLVWLMCAGGIAALKHNQHPRVTALVRLFGAPKRLAIDRGLRLVLLAFLLWLVAPAWRLTLASAGERLAASGLSGATISVVLPVALILMAAVLVREIVRDGLDAWRDPTALRWSLGAAGLALASVFVPLLLDAEPLAVLISGFLVTAALGVPLAFTLALTSLIYLLGIGGVDLIILPIKILGGVDSFVLLAIPLFILAGALMEAGGISRRLVALASAMVGHIRGGHQTGWRVIGQAFEEFFRDQLQVPALRHEIKRRAVRLGVHGIPHLAGNGQTIFVINDVIVAIRDDHAVRSNPLPRRGLQEVNPGLVIRELLRAGVACNRRTARGSASPGCLAPPATFLCHRGEATADILVVRDISPSPTTMPLFCPTSPHTATKIR